MNNTKYDNILIIITHSNNITNNNDNNTVIAIIMSIRIMHIAYGGGLPNNITRTRAAVGVLRLQSGPGGGARCIDV